MPTANTKAAALSKSGLATDGMPQCEWCYCDNLLGEFGRVAMMKYSNKLPLHDCIEELTKEMAKSNDRPLQVKVPPGRSTAAKRFETCQAAIDYLMQFEEAAQKAIDSENTVIEKEKLMMDLEHAECVASTVLEQAQTDHEQLERNLLAAEQELRSCGNALVLTEKGMPQCEWCYCDNLLGEFGRVAMLKYSDKLSLHDCREELTKEMAKSNDRPLQVKAPPGRSTAAKRFETCQAAIDYLMQFEEAAQKAIDADKMVFQMVELVGVSLDREQVAKAAMEKAQGKLVAAKEELEIAKRIAEKEEAAMREMTSSAWDSACFACGHVLAPEAIFCSKCGTRVTPGQVAPEDSLENLRHMMTTEARFDHLANRSAR